MTKREVNPLTYMQEGTSTKSNKRVAVQDDQVVWAI